MSDPMPDSDLIPGLASEPDAVSPDGAGDPPPLVGCLYCHSEGTIMVTEGRKILGFGSGLPTLTCKNCGSVAQLDEHSENGTWRIRYKKVNRATRYYYVMVYLGGGGWVDAEEALTISRNGYVQRQRVLQAGRGDLLWLNAAPLDPPPPLMSPDESVYLTVNPVTFQQGGRGGASQDEENVLDSGSFYLTDRKIHLLGHRRDWSHKLSDIQDLMHNERYWRIYVGSSQQYYQGFNRPDQIDAQLFVAVLKALISQNLSG